MVLSPSTHEIALLLTVPISKKYLGQRLSIVGPFFAMEDHWDGLKPIEKIIVICRN
jgi:hypothetical protein